MSAPETKNGNARVQVVLSIIGTAALTLSMGVGAIWWVSNLAGRINALETEHSTISAKLADTAKEADDNRLRIREIVSKEQEIETQFCESDNVRNQLREFDERIQSMLWQKVFAQPFPTDDAFYPKICLQDPTQH